MYQTWYKFWVKRRMSPRLREALERLSIWLDYGAGTIRPLTLDSWWLKLVHWARSNVGENVCVAFSDRRHRIDVEDNFGDVHIDLHMLGGVETDPHGTIVLYYVPTGRLKKKLFFDDVLILDYALGAPGFTWVMREGLHGAGPDAVPRIVLYDPRTGWLSTKE